MIVYTVHEPGHSAQTLEERAENIVFIKEGFTWLGFIFGPVWLLFNKLWFEFLAALLLMALIFAGLSQLGLTPASASNVLSLFISLIVGFEGNNLRRWRLERKGYVFLATVAGRNYDECERRFFDAWLPHVTNRYSAAPASTVMDLKASPAPASDWRGPNAIGTLPGAMT